MSDNINLSAATEDVVNYFRLIKLTMIEGTKAIQNAVISHLPGRQTLHLVLRQKEDKIRALNKGQRSIVSNRQLSILYPANSNCDLSSIDMTLWCVLARNLIPLPRGVSVNWGDDDHPPLPGQEEWYHDIVRIRLTRNNLFHLRQPRLDTDTFNVLWNYISGPLRRLNQGVDLNNYKNAEYDRSAAREFEIQVKEQIFQEMNDVLKAGLADRRRLYSIIALIGVLVSLLLAGTVVIVYFQLHKETSCGSGTQGVIVDPLGVLSIMPRDGWKAEKPDADMEKLSLPVPIVEFTHTADVAKCDGCCAQIYNIQYQHMRIRGWSDIGFHYLIDGSGVVYEGRSVKKVSASVWGYNHELISIALLGNYMHETPSSYTLMALDTLLQYLVNVNYAYRNFTLYGMCDISVNETNSPGTNLYSAVQSGGKEYANFRHHRQGPKSQCTFNFTSKTQC